MMKKYKRNKSGWKWYYIITFPVALVAIALAIPFLYLSMKLLDIDISWE